MALPELIASSGNPQVDQIVQGVIGVYEQVFPGRILGYYLQGSCADGHLTELSDIDMAIVFQGALSAAEDSRVEEIRLACNRFSRRRLDIGAFGENSLLQADRAIFAEWDLLPVYATSIKQASRHVYGHDIRGSIPVVPIERFTRCLMHFPAPILLGHRGWAPSLPFPLDYPDPTDPFYGFTHRKLPDTTGVMHPTTKRLVHSTLFMATALVASLAHRHAGNAREAIQLYREHIGDDWSAFLEELAGLCQSRWGYHVPVDAQGQERLRELCVQGLAFANHFLDHYKTYLLGELRQPSPEIQRFALIRLRQIVYPGPDIPEAIRPFTTSEDSLVREEAAKTLEVYETTKR